MQTDNEKTKIIAFDLDDVLCKRDTDEGKVEKYFTCHPVQDMINICNECYDGGYRIIIYTARGMTSFKGNHHDIYDSLYELTKNQLNEWGVKYHKLVMGKLHYDLLIDDKAVNSQRIHLVNDIKKGLGQ